MHRFEEGEGRQEVGREGKEWKKPDRERKGKKAFIYQTHKKKCG